MSTRHVARSLALQTLFEIDMKDAFSLPYSEILDMVTRNALEFAPQVKDISFVTSLVEETVGRRITLDDIITRAAPDWPIEKISIVDRNILRIGLFELLFGDRAHVPPKVAIDEAIELAKAFGGETSGRFINGVLGAIYKELGEPGKHETSKPKEPTAREELVGAVVIHKDHDGMHIALIKDKFDHWTLPKGHVQEGVDTPAMVSMIVLAEAGATGVCHGSMGSHEYIAHRPGLGKVAKHVTYYQFTAESLHLQPVTKDGILDVAWFSPTQLDDVKMYSDIRPIVSLACSAID